MPLEYLSHEIMDEALDFAARSHADSSWSNYPFDREVLRRNLERMIGKPQYFTSIYRKDGKIVGYWFGHLGRFDFSDVTLGMESGIYIDKEHRGGRVAWIMCRAFLDWCKGLKVRPLVSIYFGENEDNGKTYQFFRKMGMRECGRVFRG